MKTQLQVLLAFFILQPAAGQQDPVFITEYAPFPGPIDTLTSTSTIATNENGGFGQLTTTTTVTTTPASTVTVTELSTSTSTVGLTTTTTTATVTQTSTSVVDVAVTTSTTTTSTTTTTAPTVTSTVATGAFFVPIASSPAYQSAAAAAARVARDEPGSAPERRSPQGGRGGHGGGGKGGRGGHGGKGGHGGPGNHGGQGNHGNHGKPEIHEFHPGPPRLYPSVVTVVFFEYVLDPEFTVTIISTAPATTTLSTSTLLATSTSTVPVLTTTLTDIVPVVATSTSTISFTVTSTSTVAAAVTPTATVYPQCQADNVVSRAGQRSFTTFDGFNNVANSPAVDGVDCCQQCARNAGCFSYAFAMGDFFGQCYQVTTDGDCAADPPPVVAGSRAQFNNNQNVFTIGNGNCGQVLVRTTA